MELQNHINNYLKFMEQSNYSKNTLISYEVSTRYLQSFVDYFNIDYKTIKGSDMINLRQQMLDYKPSTVNSRLSAIRSFYDYLIDIDVIENNPVRQSLFIRHNRNKPKPLTDNQVKLLYEYLNNKHDHIRLAFKVLLESGVRLSELTTLKPNNFIVVNNKYYIEIHESKNYKSRLVPIAKTLYTEVISYIESNNYILGTIFNLTNRGYQYHADEFSKKYNIKFSIHSCRHTFATNLARKSVPVQHIQKILGHKNIATTMYYIELSDADILNLDIYD